MKRSCEKNKRKMYYALYDDKLPIYNDAGEFEGEYRSGYKAPVEFRACLSVGQSDSEDMPFGTNVSYDRIISTTDITLPIDETTILWIKKIPEYNNDGTVNSESADYKVSASPIDGISSLRIAIKSA